MIELRHLRVFRMVAELRHFSRAAERMRSTQPVVSRTIRDLESELGVVLFERTSKRVALTDAGASYLREITAVLDQLDAAKEEARRNAQGVIGKLSVMISPFTSLTDVPKKLRSFLDRCPDVELQIHERCSIEIISAVTQGTCDIGCVVRHEEYRDLCHSDACSLRINVVLPAAHRHAGARTLELRELADERFIFTKKSSEPRLFQLFQSNCRQAGFEPHVAFEVDQIETTLSLVSAEHGVALLPELGAMRFDGIVQVPLAPETFGGITLVWSRSGENPCRERLLRHLLDLGPRSQRIGSLAIASAARTSGSVQDRSRGVGPGRA